MGTSAPLLPWVEMKPGMLRGMAMGGMGIDMVMEASSWAQERRAASMAPDGRNESEGWLGGILSRCRAVFGRSAGWLDGRPDGQQNELGDFA